MHKSGADYISTAKTIYGNPFMSDRELGERLGGFSQSLIWKAKAGNMSDPLATAIGRLLESKGIIQAGIVLLTARCEREKDTEVRGVWEELLGKISPLMPMQSAAHFDFVTGGMGGLPSPEGTQTRCIMLLSAMNDSVFALIA